MNDVMNLDTSGRATEFRANPYELYAFGRSSQRE